MVNISNNNKKDHLKMNEVRISAFDMYQKRLGNRNETNRVSPTSFNIHCNRKELSLQKK